MRFFGGLTAKLLCVSAVLLSSSIAFAYEPTEDVELFGYDSDWRYLIPVGVAQDPSFDFNSNFDTDWYTNGYNDAQPVDIAPEPELNWQTGIGPFQYDPTLIDDPETPEDESNSWVDGLNPDNAVVIAPWIRDVSTLLPSAPDSDRYSAYFRKQTALPAGDVFLEFLVDDAAVIYLDGAEVGRYNITADPAVYTSFGDAAGGETNVQVRQLKSGPAGNFLLAVSAHQVNTTSSDFGFAARAFLAGNARRYGVDGSGNWGDDGNWQISSPNSSTLFAVFDEAQTPAGHTIVTDV
ncbi:MAG: hypothetical protein KDA60_08580, partial [Planctomycetales bacterium]|nr:hypothetical protein [Planctomycetales bacterium]